MSFYLSKDQLYREQPFYAEAKSHIILPSAVTSTGVSAKSYPTHVIAIPVSNSSQDIDIAINRSQFQVLDAWVVKNGTAAGVGDDVILKFLDQSGTPYNVATFTSPDFETALAAGYTRSNFPQLDGIDNIFADRCILRVSANKGGPATNVGCTVYVQVGLV